MVVVLVVFTMTYFLLFERRVLIDLFHPRLPPKLLPDNNGCFSSVSDVISLFLNLFAILLPATRPATSPATLLIICPAVELPQTLFAPAATPEETLAPRIASPAPNRSAVPLIKYASPAALAPLVNAAAPVFLAIAATF